MRLGFEGSGDVKVKHLGSYAGVLPPWEVLYDGAVSGQPMSKKLPVPPALISTCTCIYILI